MGFNLVISTNHTFGASWRVLPFIAVIACSTEAEPPNVAGFEHCDAQTPTTCLEEAEALRIAGQTAEAGTLLDAACERFHAPSCRQLGLWARDDDAFAAYQTRFLSLLTRADAEDDARATLEIGRSYMNGMGVDINYATAAGKLERACGRDVAEGCYHLGMLLTQGQLPLDVERAGRAFMSGCRLGEGSSCWNVSSMMEQGVFDPGGDHTVASLKARACELGATGACE